MNHSRYGFVTTFDPVTPEKCAGDIYIYLPEFKVEHKSQSSSIKIFEIEAEKGKMA